MTLILDADDITDLDLKGRNIYFSPVDLNVAVIDQLPGLSAGSRKTRAVDRVVQPALQQKEKIFARNTLLPRGFFEIIAELFLQYEVNALDLLFFPKLKTVTGQRLASAIGTMLTGRVRSAFLDRAGRFKTPVAFQK